jgi:AmiR/NasT family two-component response regulator
MSSDLRDGVRDGAAESVSLVAVEPVALVREVQRLRNENGQLARALETRIVIEQAKGVLSERYRIPLEAAFELLRHAARSNRMNIHILAAKVVSASETPPEFGRVRPPDTLRTH